MIFLRRPIMMMRMTMQSYICFTLTNSKKKLYFEALMMILDLTLDRRWCSNMKIRTGSAAVGELSKWCWFSQIILEMCWLRYLMIFLWIWVVIILSHWHETSHITVHCSGSAWYMTPSQHPLFIIQLITSYFLLQLTLIYHHDNLLALTSIDPFKWFFTFDTWLEG